MDLARSTLIVFALLGGLTFWYTDNWGPNTAETVDLGSQELVADNHH